jgi:hypothetical protein
MFPPYNWLILIIPSRSQLSLDTHLHHLHTAQQQLQAAGRVAAAAFWDSLHDFVGLRLCPAGWLDHIPPNHPFLCNAWEGEERVLWVNRLAQPA